MSEVVRAEIRFPLRSGSLAGCAEVTLTVPLLPDVAAGLVASPERCEGRCGALVGTSEKLSGDRFRWAEDLLSPLAEVELPVGLWEPPRDDLDDDGEPVQTVVFHSTDRCRELRS